MSTWVRNNNCRWQQLVGEFVEVENQSRPSDADDERSDDDIGDNLQKSSVNRKSKLSSWSAKRTSDDVNRTMKQGEDQEEEDSESENTNCIFKSATTPFELPHVFDEILQYLPLKDWKNCRQISHKWYVACTNQGRLKNFRFCIPEKIKFKSVISLGGQIEWGRSLLLNNPEKVFRDVKLPVGVPLDNKNLLEFLEQFGHHLKSLTIPDGWTIQGLKTILFKFCVNLEELRLTGNIPDTSVRIISRNAENEMVPPQLQLPNLKKLIFEISNAHRQHQLVELFPPGFFDTGANPVAKTLISDLLSLTPNLEWVQCPTRRDMKQRDPTMTARLAMLNDCTMADVETSFNRVNQFLAQKLFSGTHDCNPKLTGLHLYLRLNARGMDKLAVKGYPLQSIDLHVRSIDKRGLQELLPKLGNTLKHLRLTVDNKLCIDFPCKFFIVLETLYLEDYAGGLLFVDDIPKLKSLTLGYFNSNFFVKKSAQPFTNSTLKSLTIEKLLLPDQQARCLKRLSTNFPHVTKLIMDAVSDKDLQKVYDAFPQLEELQINSNSVSNAGISGFTDADSEAILDTGYMVDKYEEYEKLRRLPYIGDLKNLKSLTITGQLNLLSSRFVTGRLMNTLHSLWILHGICSLSNLRVLTVYDVSVSAIEMKQLLRTLLLCRLEFVNCRIDSATLSWVQKKLRTTALEFVNRSASINPTQIMD